jgi:hypothetical protein
MPSVQAAIPPMRKQKSGRAQMDAAAAFCLVYSIFGMDVDRKQDAK